MNTAWLEAMGIPIVAPKNEIAASTGLSRDVVRDDSGKATGRLEGGFPMVGRAIARFPPVSEDEQIESIRDAMRHYNRLGLTSVYDPGGLGIQDESYHRIQKLADFGETTLRVFHTLWGGLDSGKAEETVKRLESEKPFRGSATIERVALGEVYYAPFHFDSTSTYASPTENDVEMAGTILMAAAAAGWPVQTHAVQPETMSRLFDVAEKIDETHPIRALRWAITHADHIGAPEIERARNLGMNIQLRSTPVVGGQDAAIRLLGEAAVLDMPPLRLVQDSGIPYGLGTDGTKAAQINPFVTLWWATTGKRLDGKVVGRQVLTREEALIAHTRSNAYLMFQEANLGAIQPGLRADLIVLDRDSLTIPIDEIKEIEVVGTIVSGKLVHRNAAWR